MIGNKVALWFLWDGRLGVAIPSTVSKTASTYQPPRPLSTLWRTIERQSVWESGVCTEYGIKVLGLGVAGDGWVGLDNEIETRRVCVDRWSGPIPWGFRSCSTALPLYHSYPPCSKYPSRPITIPLIFNLTKIKRMGQPNYSISGAITSSAFLFVPFVIDWVGGGGEVWEVLVEGRRMISMTLPRRVRASGEISVWGKGRRV